MRPMWNRYRNVETNSDVLCAWNTVVFHVLSPRVVAVAVAALSLGRADTTFIVPVADTLCTMETKKDEKSMLYTLRHVLPKSVEEWKRYMPDPPACPPCIHGP